MTSRTSSGKPVLPGPTRTATNNAAAPATRSAVTARSPNIAALGNQLRPTPLPLAAQAMMRRLACLIAALALRAGLAASASPARAASPVPTVMTLAPVPVTYPALQATVSGTLMTQATSSSPAQPVPGEQVTIRDGIGCLGLAKVVGTATTAADGSFSVTPTAPGSFWADFAGDASYARSGTSTDTAPSTCPPRSHWSRSRRSSPPTPPSRSPALTPGRSAPALLSGATALSRTPPAMAEPGSCHCRQPLRRLQARHNPRDRPERPELLRPGPDRCPGHHRLD